MEVVSGECAARPSHSLSFHKERGDDESPRDSQRQRQSSSFSIGTCATNPAASFRTMPPKALPGGQDLHPILKLGWKPLCEVHCNGLTGGLHNTQLHVLIVFYGLCSRSDFGIMG